MPGGWVGLLIAACKLSKRPSATGSGQASKADAIRTIVTAAPGAPQVRFLTFEEHEPTLAAAAALLSGVITVLPSTC
jgi:hypothetical protein